MCVCFGVCFACSQAIPYFSEVSVLFAIYEELPRYFIAQKAIKQKAILSCLSAKGEFFFVTLPFEHCQSGYFASAWTWKKAPLMSLSALALFYFTIEWMGLKNSVLPWHLYKRNWIFCLTEYSLSLLGRQESLLILNSSCSSLAISNNSVGGKSRSQACRLRLLEEGECPLAKAEVLVLLQ